MTDKEIEKYYLIGIEDEKNDTVTKVPQEAEAAYMAGLRDEREEIVDGLPWEDILGYIKEDMEEC